MYPHDDGVGAFGRYEDDERCPVCFVPPSAVHLDSCEYAGVWDGGDDDQEPGPSSTGHWGG